MQDIFYVDERPIRCARLMRTLMPFLFLIIVAISHAEEKAAETATVKFRVIGMFSPDREADLRQASAKMHDYTLAAVDYANNEATFSYAANKIPKNAKPDRVLNEIDSQLKEASNHTFGISPLIANRDKLTRVEIHVGILDCKACAYGVYLTVTGVGGVEQATVARDGLVNAWIDAEKTNRAALVAMLKMREITVKDPDAAAK